MQRFGVKLPASTISGAGVERGAGVSAVGMQSPGVGLPASTIREAGTGGSAVVSAVGMQSPGVGFPASTINGGGGAGALDILPWACNALAWGFLLALSAAEGGEGALVFNRGHAMPCRGASGQHHQREEGASPFQFLSIAPCAGVGQSSPDLVSAAFVTANSYAPEDFQQSRLNGEMWQSENNRQGLSSAPQDFASLH
eukprot:jgi/Undpi1/9256/HiC_scaffold_26.g11714.m1